MSGFSTEWLDLREPADHAARDGRVLSRACAFLDTRTDALVVDLGCGTGSTVRALAPRLARPVRWRLVDNDPALLADAVDRLPPFDIARIEADLRDIDGLPVEDAALVTASALFDLVSDEWLRRFAARIAAAGTGLYAALNYDGQLAFPDVHPLDEEVREAFNVHQRGDKGFGPALGPDSGTALVDRLSATGFAVEHADSAWELPKGRLRDELLEGVAQAVGETGRIDPATLRKWLFDRQGADAIARVGHLDVLALPR